MSIIGHFVMLEKKKESKIKASSPIHYSQQRLDEYIRKIEFYLPYIRVNGDIDYESYPRRTLYSFNSPCGICEYSGLCLNDDMAGIRLDIQKPASNGEFYISPTQLLRYETCPRQWAYYKMGFRQEIEAATLSFGNAVHSAIEAFLMLDKNPEDAFDFFWGEYRDIPLKYNKKENHGSLEEVGKSLMRQFPDFWEQTKKEFCIKELRSEISSSKYLPDLNIYLTGKPDLVCRTSTGITIVFDWKVANREYDTNWLQFADQMTAYFLLIS